MHRSPASLITLALMLGACVVRAQHSAKAAAAAVSNVTYCELLAAKQNVNNSSSRSVSLDGRTVNVTLVWGSEPAHAAAALLSALLSRVLLYRGVRLPGTPHPHATAALADNFTYNATHQYSNLVIGVSTAWEPEPPLPWNQSAGPSPGLAGPRLEDYGVSSVPARRRLFAWLEPTARERDSCRQRVRWAFYANQTALADCGFVGAANPQGKVTAVEVLEVGDCGSTLQLLHARANATETRLNPRHVNRADFVRTMQTANRSFLFLDYDMWKGAPGVTVVEPPPCVAVDITHDSECKQELDSTIAMRVADVGILKTYAPQLFQFVYDFKPSPESLRWILTRQASGADIEEAGCEWALENKRYDLTTKERVEYDLSKYTVVIYVCSGDPNNELYDDIIKLMGNLIYDQTSKIRCRIQMQRFFMNCSDDYHMNNRLLKDFIRTMGFYQLVGVVSMTVEGAAAASATAAASHVPLMLADVVPEDGSAAAGATWRVAGRPRHIARALHHFVRASGWTRVAVLSQDTRLATDYNAALKEKTDIIFRNFPIPLHLTKQQAQAVLQDLQATNARIVFVNADSQAAHTILTAAVASGMGYTDGFVWIVRDWRQNNVSCATKHFTVSFWVRGVEDLPAAEGQAKLHKKLSIKLKRSWPPLAVSLANALLTLSIGIKDVFKRFPDRRLDLHTSQMIRSLQESLIETPVTGVTHRLIYKERTLEETFVFVDQWRGSRFIKRLATWRVDATSGVVRGKNEEHANYSRLDDLPRDDGASGCFVRSGDEFDPTCRDAECLAALLLLALAPGAGLLARRALRRRIARLQQEQQIQAIARRRHVATVLAAYLVERAALELHEELGAGRFGSVHLARLRKPARATRYIAAKALHDNAAPDEESEFLREACTIASLDHAHIVRLVGVCIADGPPLVLMELAFFGDLLGYLRARRHLVEDAALEAPAESGEAEHLSAEALTRLAREAAEALQYLCVRGVVHRDVCAANCLVDVRRSLKLADFGLARDTVAGADGASEYSCRRRGVFPVRRMAPESIAHGVFSAASDVWALGLLVLELVTLGARPYGTMSSTRVLEYVAAGGSPPLPLDATPQTCGLARLCWARAAERRPSAAEVATYLAAWPQALRPALLSERDEPADADSGFGESPSTQLLPPESPFNSLEQFEDLAATH